MGPGEWELSRKAEEVYRPDWAAVELGQELTGGSK